MGLSLDVRGVEGVEGGRGRADGNFQWNKTELITQEIMSFSSFFQVVRYGESKQASWNGNID
jgi:hypothetical protein